MATDVLYVFVEISIDTPHLVDTVALNFAPEQRLALCGTIQIAGALHAARAALSARFATVELPQCRPLSAGEVLGCTSPQLDGFVRVSTSQPSAAAPLQSAKPLAQPPTTQRPEAHALTLALGSAHTTPHAPQCAGFDAVRTQSPAHAVVPAPQVAAHTPALHT
jgi:hypothetical protein